MSDGNWDERVLEAVGLIMAGRYLSVPEGDCAVTRKLKVIANALESEAKASLSGTVSVSGQINAAVIDVAEMMAEISEVDRRAQVVASGAATLVRSINGIAEAAQSATRDAEQALNQSVDGKAYADQAEATMDAIGDAVTHMAASLDGLTDAVTHIADVVGRIQSVSTRINLLSLNASVEASRAGDHGRGFTVVAQEIALLAERSAAAGKDIRRRLRTLRRELSGIVDAMNGGADAVAQGRSVIARTGADTDRVVARLNGVVARMTKVSTILEQQTQATDEVSGSIGAVAGMASHDVGRIAEVIEVLHHAAKTVARSLAFFNGIEITDIALFLAKSDHMMWRARLADVLLGNLGLREQELDDVRACRFGRWYYAVHDPSLRNHPAYQAVEPVHDRVHALGRLVVDRHGAGDLTGALEALKSMEAESERLIGLMDDLLVRTNG
jgi:methyl-accepting chemotaxis protein